MAKTKSVTKSKSPKRVKPKVNPLDPKPKKTALSGGNGKKKKVAGAGAFNGATSKSKNKKSALSKKTKKA